MKHPMAPAGILFIALGIAALIHPRLVMPAKRSERQESNQRVLIETRRIVTVPWYLSGLLILAGAGFMLLGPRKP